MSACEFGMNLTLNENTRAPEQPASTTTATAATTEAERTVHALPDKPLVTIKRSNRWVAIDFRDLWEYRELLYFLIWRDVKVRYKQTLLGVAWVVIQPLFTTVIFTLFFGILAGVPSEGVPYPIFAFAGLLPWTFFSNAVTQSGNSLVGSAHLITKVYFPRIIVPSAAVGAGLVDFFISFAVLLGLMVYYHVAVTWSILMLPVLMVLVTLLALGVGMWLSALNVKYRDIRQVLPFMMQVWMFASPLIYPPTFVPERWRWLLVLNPMTGIIDGFRSAIFGKDFNWASLSVSAALALALLVYSAYAFKRMEKNFADLV